MINKARLEQLWFLWLIQGLEQENFPHKNFPPSSNSALQTSFSFFDLGYDFGQSGSVPRKPNSLFHLSKRTYHSRIACLFFLSSKTEQLYGYSMRNAAERPHHQRLAFHKTENVPKNALLLRGKYSLMLASFYFKIIFTCSRRFSVLNKVL